MTHGLRLRSAEGREFRGAGRQRSNVGEIFDAALGPRGRLMGPAQGAPRALRPRPEPGTACPSGALLARRRRAGDKGRDTRALTNVGQDATAASSPYVFPQSAAMFLGVDMPTVPSVGESVFPVLTKELDVRTPAENADARRRPRAAFSADVLSPWTDSGEFLLLAGKTGRVSLAWMQRSRENLSEGLSRRAGQANPEPALTACSLVLTLPNNAQATNDTFDSYLVKPLLESD